MKRPSIPLTTFDQRLVATLDCQGHRCEQTPHLDLEGPLFRDEG